MKSFWTSCAIPRRRGALLLVLAAVLVVGAGGKKRGLEELTNFLLGPDYSQWLVGPIAAMATEAEIGEYLALTSDDAAAAFIEDFWRRRDDPERPWPQVQPQGEFEQRALQADKLFTEGTTLGRRTARGEAYILYGPPARVDFLPVAPPRRGNIEVWYYPRNAAPGLAGDKPKHELYFLQQDGLTQAYHPRVSERKRARR